MESPILRVRCRSRRMVRVVTPHFAARSSDRDAAAAASISRRMVHWRMTSALRGIPQIVLGVPQASAMRRRRSRSDRIFPAPRTTDVSGSSAIRTGRPVAVAEALVEVLEESRPPVRVMPPIADVRQRARAGCFGASSTLERSVVPGLRELARFLTGDVHGRRFPFGEVSSLDFHRGARIRDRRPDLDS